MLLSNLADVTRSEGDPRILREGPSSLKGKDRLTRALGWFSVGLGLVELVAPARIAKTLGLNGKEGLIRSYGVRELASAVPTLSVDKSLGLAARIAGDALDLVTLSSALGSNNPKQRNAAWATALVAGITLLDIAAYTETKPVRSRRSSKKDYSDRVGLPHGLQVSRGLARKDFKQPPNYLAQANVAAGISTT